MDKQNKIQSYLIQPILYVFLFGLFIRVWSSINTFVINPDGIFYIYQAKALFAGEFETAKNCGIGYVSLYPVLIGLFHLVIDNWLVAAKGVSLVFGFGVLIPIYLCAKKFFDERVSTFLVLIYAVIPVFTGRCGDVLKGPVFWFFLMWGIYFFIAGMESRKKYLMPLSCLAIIVATFSRIEGVILIPLTLFYIAVSKDERKISRIFMFSLPIILFVLVGIVVAGARGFDFHSLYRVDYIIAKIDESFSTYSFFVSRFSDFQEAERGGQLQFFFQEAKEQLWFIAFGVLLNRTIEAFFIPFFIIYVIGCFQAKKTNLKHKGYFVLLQLVAYIMIYLHIIQTWQMEYRFMGINVFSAFVFLGLGVEKVLGFIDALSLNKKRFAIVLSIIMLFVAPVVKDLKPRRESRLVFKEIGEYVRTIENNDFVKITMAVEFPMWTYLAANKKSSNFDCPGDSYKDWGNEFPDYSSLKAELINGGYDYFVLDSSTWKNESFDSMKKAFENDFTFLKQWKYSKSVTLCLFRL